MSVNHFYIAFCVDSVNWDIGRLDWLHFVVRLIAKLGVNPSHLAVKSFVIAYFMITILIFRFFRSDWGLGYVGMCD